MNIAPKEIKWDVETFKTEHECEEHWQLRRMFLLKHKDTFEEGRLVCLAQVFINMEILGCMYPEETMKLVSSLSEGIIESFREKRQSKLKRTFVQASDAAQSKAQGLKRQAGGQEMSLGGTLRTNKYFKPINFERAKNECDPQDISQKPSTADVKDTNSELTSPSNIKHANSSSSTKVKGNCIPFAPEQPRITNTFVQGPSTSIVNNSKNPFGKLILVENKYSQCPASTNLVRSFQLSGLPTENLLKTSTLRNGNSLCELLINGKVLYSSEGTTRVLARETVAQNALDNMREHCYTIEILANYISESTVDKSLQEKGVEKGGAALSSDNLGNKLMRMMGWSGGGLGKDQQGIEAPICAVEHMNRAGLGLTNLNIHQSKHKIRKLFESFLSNDSGYDLAFTSDFTKDERAAIHLLARQFNLKTKSHGTGDDRHIVVSKKERPQDILQRLIHSGGSTEKYNLIKPRCMMLI